MKIPDCEGVGWGWGGGGGNGFTTFFSRHAKMNYFMLLCLYVVCHNNLTCAPVTDAQMKCMEDAGSKFSPDVQTQCKGVDFNALTNGNVRALQL